MKGEAVQGFGAGGNTNISTENTLIYVPAHIHKNAAPALSTHMIISSHSWSFAVRATVALAHIFASTYYSVTTKHFP